MKRIPLKPCLMLVMLVGATLPALVRAAPLTYTTPATLFLTSPSTTLTIASGSVADALQVNATSVAITLSSITGGTFTLISPQALGATTSGSGGSLSQICSSSVETDTIAQASGSETYTLTPTGSACTQSVSSGGGGGTTTTPTPVSTGGGSSYYLAIDNGVATTATSSVLLSLYGTAAYTMEVSNTSTFVGATWIPYATTMPWMLALGTGERTIFVQFRGISGTIVGSAQASIDLATSSVSTPVSATIPALASSTTSLTAELAVLQSQIATLLKQAGQSATASVSTPFVFTRALSLGMTGNDVKQLQAFLTKNPALYPEGKVTGYFGTLTKKAVQRFQKKYGLAKPGQSVYGYVGPATRAKLNSLITQGLIP